MSDPVLNIIDWLLQPVQRDGYDQRRERPSIGPGVDLASHEAALRAMLRDAHEVYALALDDWETRAKSDKPKERLEANWDRDEAAYDYGDDAGAGLEDWPEWWKEHYYRPAGRPGKSQTSDLPIAPLHAVYTLVKRWWIDNVDPKFNPTYPREYEGGPRSIVEKFNPAARLLLLVAKDIDDRYTADNCANIRYTSYRAARQARRVE